MEAPSSLPTLDTVLTASTPSLRDFYKALFQRPPPKWARVDYLRGNLAWAIQAQQLGHAPHTLRQALLNKFAQPNKHAPTRSYQPGTRLIREWQGQTYEVTVLESGYLWQGRTYQSLTAISKAITGTRWSGPRFFGLKTAPNHDRK